MSIVRLIQGKAMAPVPRLRMLLYGGRVAIMVDIRWGLVGLICVEINRVVDVGRYAE